MRASCRAAERSIRREGRRAVAAQRVTERGEGQQDDAVGLTHLVEFPLRVIRVRLDFHHRRLDAGSLQDFSGALGIDVGEADRPREALVDQDFHRRPGVRQRDPVVVDDGPMDVAGS